MNNNVSCWKVAMYSNKSLIKFAPFSDGRLPRRCCGLKCTLDGWKKQRQYAAIGFNQPTSRGKLAQTGRQAAKVSTRLSGVFTSANSPCFTFHGERGQGSAMPSWFVLPVSHPLPFACRPPCENGKRQRSQNER